MRIQIALIATGLMLASSVVPSVAQPIIIPLDKNSENPRAPEASAPPVAPPQAGPSIPNDVASANGTDRRPEEAYQPPATPPR